MKVSTVHSSRSGFSLVELLVASTVLAVGVAGVLMATVSARGLIRTAQETRVATLAAQEVLDQIELLEATEVVAEYPEGEAVPIADYGLENLVVVPGYPDYTPGDPMVTVEVAVAWTTFDGATRRLTFETVDS